MAINYSRWVRNPCTGYSSNVVADESMEDGLPYLLVRGWEEEWNDIMDMEAVLKKHFEAEANGAEVASVIIKGTEARIMFKNSQGMYCHS